MQNSILNHGYYKVGQEVFDRKLSALSRATETGIAPTWHFHSEIYGKQDWTGTPQETLDFDLSKKGSSLASTEPKNDLGEVRFKELFKLPHDINGNRFMFIIQSLSSITKK